MSPGSSPCLSPCTSVPPSSRGRWRRPATPPPPSPTSGAPAGSTAPGTAGPDTRPPGPRSVTCQVGWRSCTKTWYLNVSFSDILSRVITARNSSDILQRLIVFTAGGEIKVYYTQDIPWAAFSPFFPDIRAQLGTVHTYFWQSVADNFTMYVHILYSKTHWFAKSNPYCSSR